MWLATSGQHPLLPQSEHPALAENPSMNACGARGQARLGSQGSVMQTGYLPSSEGFSFFQRDIGVEVGLSTGPASMSGQFSGWDLNGRNGRCSMSRSGNQQLPSPQASVAGSPSGMKGLRFASPMSSEHFPRRMSQSAHSDGDPRVVEQRQQVRVAGSLLANPLTATAEEGAEPHSTASVSRPRKATSAGGSTAG